MPPEKTTTEIAECILKEISEQPLATQNEIVDFVARKLTTARDIEVAELEQRIIAIRNVTTDLKNKLTFLTTK